MPHLTPENHAMRRSGLGASDTPAILPDIDYYVTPFEVWWQKTHRDTPPTEPEPGSTRWFLLSAGSFYETPIRKMFEELTGKRTRAVHQTRRHQECRHVLATLDGTVVGERAVLEVKNRGMWRIKEYGPSGTDQVLDSDLIQVHQQMAVTGATSAYMAVLLGGQNLRWYHIGREPALIDLVLERVESFWREHVETGEPPVLDYADERTRGFLRMLHSEYTDDIVELGEDGAALDHQIKDAQATIRGATAQKTEATNRLLARLGDARLGRLPDGTYWERKRVSVAGYSVAPRVQERFDWRRRLKGAER